MGIAKRGPTKVVKVRKDEILMVRISSSKTGVAVIRLPPGGTATLQKSRVGLKVGGDVP